MLYLQSGYIEGPMIFFDIIWYDLLPGSDSVHEHWLRLQNPWTELSQRLNSLSDKNKTGVVWSGEFNILGALRTQTSKLVRNLQIIKSCLTCF